ncbi:MAG TPA: ApaG domain [Verrucomicrobiales bacterium]|nr:ApaG domain [Verrucomicrobiales bacterium]
MSDKSAITPLKGLRVTVDRVVHAPEAQGAGDRSHCFVYFISIHNDSKETVTIRGRKWVVTEGDGETTVVEGDGVVGKVPKLKPGQKFSYNSFHLLASDQGKAEGSFFGVDGSGRRVMTRIPPFEMRVPEE